MDSQQNSVSFTEPSNNSNPPKNTPTESIPNSNPNPIPGRVNETNVNTKKTSWNKIILGILLFIFIILSCTYFSLISFAKNNFFSPVVAFIPFEKIPVVNKYLIPPEKLLVESINDLKEFPSFNEGAINISLNSPSNGANLTLYNDFKSQDTLDQLDANWDIKVSVINENIKFKVISDMKSGKIYFTPSDSLVNVIDRYLSSYSKMYPEETELYKNLIRGKNIEFSTNDLKGLSGLSPLLLNLNDISPAIGASDTNLTAEENKIIQDEISNIYKVLKLDEEFQKLFKELEIQYGDRQLIDGKSTIKVTVQTNTNKLLRSLLSIAKSIQPKIKANLDTIAASICNISEVYAKKSSEAFDKNECKSGLISTYKESPVEEFKDSSDYLDLSMIFNLDSSSGKIIGIAFNFGTEKYINGVNGNIELKASLTSKTNQIIIPSNTTKFADIIKQIQESTKVKGIQDIKDIFNLNAD